MAATSYWILIYTTLVTVLGLLSSLNYSKIVFFKLNSFETFFKVANFFGTLPVSTGYWPVWRTNERHKRAKSYRTR